MNAPCPLPVAGLRPAMGAAAAPVHLRVRLRQARGVWHGRARADQDGWSKIERCRRQDAACKQGLACEQDAACEQGVPGAGQSIR